MAKLSLEQQEEYTIKYSKKLTKIRESIQERNLLYDLRKGYYDGTIVPQVERNHDVIYTQYAQTIVERFAAYLMANGVAIKLKPKNVSEPAEVLACEKAGGIVDELYNDNDEFTLHLLNFTQLGGLYGDGYLGTEDRDGIPAHYAVMQPQNIGLKFDDDNYNSFNAYMYERWVDLDEIEETYGVTVAGGSSQKPGLVYGSNGTHLRPYGDLQGKRFKENYDDKNMGRVTVLHDFNTGERIQFINDRAYFADKSIENIYHFVGNFDANNPYGISDFESCAQIITKLEEKLSEESDSATSAVQHKIITDQEATSIQKKWNPKKTQLYHVKSKPNGQPGRLEILNTNINNFPTEQMIGQLMNILRTNSGLQELGQDTISANVSGRALAFMFQGVTQKIKTKRIRLNTLLKQLVLDDLEIISKGNSELRKALFNEDGTFKLKIQIKYPPVMEQDEQIRISNLQLMANSGMISKFSSRLHLSDYIDDPTEEEKRIDQEKQKEIDNLAKQKAAEAKVTTPTEGQASSVTPGGMDVGGQGMGQVATEGMPGSSQQGISPEGLVNQQNQNATGQQF